MGPPNRLIFSVERNYLGTFNYTMSPGMEQQRRCILIWWKQKRIKELWMSAVEPLWWHVNISSGNCLVPPGNKPWKHFPRYWPFVRGIHRSPLNSPHKGQWGGAFFNLCLNKRLSKQSWGWWFETLLCPLWRHCNEDVTMPQCVKQGTCRVKEVASNHNHKA